MLYSFLVTLGVAAIVIQVAVFSTTIYLHRAATHGALKLRPFASWLFRLALWLTTGILTKEWVAVHRKHHAFTDEEGDPHSPMLMGFWSVQLGNVFHYIKEARNQETVDRYARDIKDDVWDRLFFNHGTSGLIIGVASLCAILGIGWGLLAAGIHAVMYVFVLSSSINGLCHVVGYKNFPDENAFNLKLVAFVTGGEGFHNNHHGFPRSPKFSYGPGELDPAWPVIKLLVRAGLAKPDHTIEERLAEPELDLA
jgi:stearoyl-CoA desaturase (delta-9 desaturase)